MTIPVTFDGFEIHKIVDDIILQPRPLATTFNNNYLDQGSNRNGQAFLYNTRGVKQLPFDFSVRGSHQDFINVTNKLASILDVDEPKQLIFGDEPNKVWYAIPTGQQSTSADYQTSPPTFRGTIIFDVPSGRSESKNYSILGTSNPSGVNGEIETVGKMYRVHLNNNGTSETEPVFTFKHKTENGYIGIFGENNEYFTIGNKEDPDKISVQKSELLLDYRDDNIITGLSNSIKGQAILNDTTQAQNGTFVIDNSFGRPHIFMNNSGGTIGNNCASLTWEIPSDSNGETGSLNDYIWWRQVFRAGLSSQYGFIKLTVSDENDQFLYGVETFKRSIGTKSEYNFMVADGKGSYTIVDRKIFDATESIYQNPFNSTRGWSDIRRNDDKITFFWWGSYIPFVIPAIKGKKSKKIHLAIGTVGNIPKVTYMFLDSIYYQKDFVDSLQDIPNRYPAGSTVEINMETGKIIVNGNDASDEHLDDSEFFSIKKGKTDIDVYFSSWIDQLPEMTLKWKERQS